MRGLHAVTLDEAAARAVDACPPHRAADVEPRNRASVAYFERFARVSYDGRAATATAPMQHLATADFDAYARALLDTNARLSPGQYSPYDLHAGVRAALELARIKPLGRERTALENIAIALDG